MRGIQISQYVKGPKDLKVTDIPEPIPGPDQYLIEVRAAATNFFDILQIQGKYQNQPPFPWTAGAEFAGTVLRTPSNLPTPKYPIGTPVFGATQGSFASLCTATESQLLPIPKGWSFPAAAGLFVTAPTSYAALTIRANLQPGETVLVHAGAGGVGLAAVQIAKALGAGTVIATAGSARKLEVAKQFGADYAVDYREKTWPEQVKKLTKGKGVDVIYDPVGLVEQSTKCVAWNGRIVVVGFAAGKIEKVAMNRVLLKNISLVGVHWGAYTVNETGAIGRVWEGIGRLVEGGKLRGTEFTDREFVGLESVPEALAALGGRQTWGKVVVKVPREGGEKL